MANFNATVNQSINLIPYVSMVDLLAIILLVLILASRLKSFMAVLTNEYTRKDQLICMVIFLILGFLSTFIVMGINNFDSDIRIMIVTIAGLFGGPIIGIPTAIVSSIIVWINGGGATAYFVVSTIICGVISSAVYVWNGRKFLRPLPTAILMFLFIGFDMLMVILMTPASFGIPMVLNIYLPMVFAGFMGILMFEMIIAEVKMDADKEPLDTESEIKELKTSLKEYEEKIKRLEEEIEKK
jgi:two-component system LytT family sensor kinase